MSVYAKKKEYIGYQIGNLVYAELGNWTEAARILSMDSTGWQLKLERSGQIVFCDPDNVFPLEIEDLDLKQIGFIPIKDDDGFTQTNGRIDLKAIDQVLESYYAFEDKDDYDEEDFAEQEPDLPDPDQLSLDLIIYPPKNPVEPVDFVASSTYNLLYDLDGDWKALQAYKARLEKSTGNGKSFYDNFISDNPIVTHQGYEVRITGSHQMLYNTVVYNEDSEVLEGLVFVHELQNLCSDKLTGYVFLEDTLNDKKDSEIIDN